MTAARESGPWNPVMLYFYAQTLSFWVSFAAAEVSCAHLVLELLVLALAVHKAVVQHVELGRDAVLHDAHAQQLALHALQLDGDGVAGIRLRRGQHWNQRAAGRRTDAVLIVAYTIHGCVAVLLESCTRAFLASSLHASTGYTPPPNR